MLADEVVAELRRVAGGAAGRRETAERIAELIRESGDYRWVGVYDVDHEAKLVSNIAWSGPSPPAHPSFPVTKGLTGRAIAEKRTVNVGDVARDPEYLTALSGTRSEIIVPVVSNRSGAVVGTIDVESLRPDAFDAATQAFLEKCAEAVRVLWTDRAVVWEWSPEEIRRVGYRVVDLIARHLSEVPHRPVFRPFPPELASRWLEAPPPENDSAPDDILDEFLRDIEPYPFGNGHPRFYAWVNSPPTVMGIFADALAAAMNPSCAGGNHAAIYLERMVVNWFKSILGLPRDAMGLLVSGASMAALTALCVARQARCGFDVRSKGNRGTSARLVFYKSGEGHGCHQKALELMGIGSENLRIVDHDSAMKMSPAALDAAIREDRSRGHLPIAVIATAGSVNTGAIDPLEAIADICTENDVWLHVDGAYGAPAVLSSEYAGPLAAISRADSVALDPHKWLCVPVEAGLVIVRDARAMRAAFSLVPPYLQTDGSTAGVGGPPWFSEYGFQQTRGFRALKVWMSLRHYGLSGYRRAVDRTISMARRLAVRLREADDFELLEPQEMSIVCFRCTPRDSPSDGAALDKLNRAILEKVQLGGRAFLSGTVLNGGFWLRACILNPGASDADLSALLDIIRDARHS